MSSERADVGTRAARKHVVAVAVGLALMLAGSILAVWAWTRPFSQDPITTYPVQYAGRPDLFVRLTVGGVALAAVGLVTIGVGIGQAYRSRSGRR